MTPLEFVESLRTVSARQRVFIDYQSSPGMNKKGNPFMTGLLKHSRFHADINFSYQEEMSREMGEPFFSGHRVWGTRIPNSPLVEHKGNFYLECLPVQDVGEPYYTYQGEVIELEKIFPYLKSSGEDYAVVRPRDLKIEGINTISFSNGVTWRR